jgi:hypothetical protein
MFERFDDIHTKRHEYAREWKKRIDGKVIGNFTFEGNIADPGEVDQTAILHRMDEIMRAHGHKGL